MTDDHTSVQTVSLTAEEIFVKSFVSLCSDSNLRVMCESHDRELRLSLLAATLRAISSSLDIIHPTQRCTVFHTVNEFLESVSTRMGIEISEGSDIGAPPEVSMLAFLFNYSPYNPAVWKFVVNIDPEDQFYKDVNKYL